MRKWRVELMFGGEITPVEVVRETAHFAILGDDSYRANEFREYKIKKAGIIFDTFQEAKAALVDDAKERVDIAERRLHQARERLKNCKKITEPTT